jgi:hypothetical protein
LVLRCPPSKYYALEVRGNVIEPHYVEPVVIRGSFGAFRGTEGHYRIVPETGEIMAGAWEDQGYPAFCGSAAYIKQVHVAVVEGRYWLLLEDVRHVAEVELNGVPIGVRLWPPFAYELTEYLRSGSNELVVRVTNGFGRLIRHSYLGRIAHPVLSGLLGRVWLLRTTTDL